MERNTDPKTRYRVELACGHTVVRQYPPTMTKGVCSQCDAPFSSMQPVVAWTDTLLDQRTPANFAA